MKKLAGCLIIENGKILLLHRIDKQHWELPGGVVKEGESIEQAAKREVMEEIKCEVEIQKDLGEIKFSINNQNFSGHVFIAGITKGIPEIVEMDVFDKLAFIDISELNTYILAPNIMLILERLK